jgi:hypothetical protein
MLKRRYSSHGALLRPRSRVSVCQSQSSKFGSFNERLGLWAHQGRRTMQNERYRAFQRPTPVRRPELDRLLGQCRCAKLPAQAAVGVCWRISSFHDRIFSDKQIGQPQVVMNAAPVLIVSGLQHSTTHLHPREASAHASCAEKGKPRREDLGIVCPWIYDWMFEWPCRGGLGVRFGANRRHRMLDVAHTVSVTSAG